MVYAAAASPPPAHPQMPTLARCDAPWPIPPAHTSTFPRFGALPNVPQVFVSHWNRSGYHVARSEKRYGQYLARSLYCLAPPGAGHGQRQIQALFMGCVPVTIADGVAEPFEPAVNW